jgi:hypothetical protein
LPGLHDLLFVLPVELVLTFLAGVLTGVVFLEGIVQPRRRRRDVIWRRLHDYARRFLSP